MSMFVMATRRNAQFRQRRGVADWLGLAASPTFASMAWFATSEAASMPMCSMATGPLPIDGMAWMYLLMCLFHIPPWLKLVSGRTRPINQPTSRIEGD